MHIHAIMIVNVRLRHNNIRILENMLFVVPRFMQKVITFYLLWNLV